MAEEETKQETPNGEPKADSTQAESKSEPPIGSLLFVGCAGAAVFTAACWPECD